jgi:thiol-disulfide isomerase/thioredoxin
VRVLFAVVIALSAKMGCASDNIVNLEHDKPEVGEPMPNFVLHNVTHFTKTTASLSDFAGKWLVLDFWASFCPPCIKSFPKMSELQKRFADRVQIVMVGMIGQRSGDDLDRLKAMYEKFRARDNLDLVVAYDSALSVQWDIWAVPTYIIVDDAGIVRAMLHSLTEEELTRLMAGWSIEETQPNVQDESKQNDTGVLFRTELAQNTGEPQYVTHMEFERIADKCRFMLRMVPLFELYRYAYFGQYGWDMVSDSLYGKVYPMPLLELADTSRFGYSFEKGYRHGLYNYSVTVDTCADKNKKFLMDVMQDDLERYFGYQASIETREMPCYRLVVTNSKAVADLRTKGGDGRYPTADAAGFTVRNVPIQLVMSVIAKYHADKHAPMIDETGIDYNIDITLDAMMMDLDDIRRGLKANGLDLIPSRKEMRVLVIRDPES